MYSYAGLPTVEGAWLVTGFNNGSAVTSPLLGSELTADFAPDGTVSGSAGCNHFSAAYTTDGSAITFGPILTTLMACPDADVTAQETQYLAALAASVAWSQAPGTLTLTRRHRRHPGHLHHRRGSQLHRQLGRHRCQQRPAGTGLGR